MEKDLLKQLKERHEFWWNYLLNNTSKPEEFNRNLPKIKYIFKNRSLAGVAYYHSCRYNLNYLFYLGIEEFDSTICHELCHVYISRLRIRCCHGSLWQYLVNVVCGLTKEEKYHHYKLHEKQHPTVSKIEVYMKLKEKLNSI